MGTTRNSQIIADTIPAFKKPEAGNEVLLYLVNNLSLKTLSSAIIRYLALRELRQRGIWV